MKNFFSPQRRSCLWHTPHKITTICLLVALLSGLIPPPTAQSMAIVPLPDAVVAPVSDMAAAGLPTAAIVAERPVAAVVAAPPASVVANAVPGGTTSTQITGTVFRDFNSDGMKSTGSITDTGVSGVTVTAYDATGTQAGVAATASNGDYTITGLTAGVAYRVEFSTLPSGYFPTTHGSGVGDTNGTTVQFAAAGTSQVSLGINYPDDYSQANPQFVIPLYKPGNSGATALEKFSYDAPKTGDDSGIPESLLAGTGVEDPVSLATPAEIGTVWGVAYQRTQDRVFTASFLRRHVAMADGPGYVYIVDPATGVVGQFNLAGVTPANAGTPIDVGSVTRISTGVAGDDNNVAGQYNRDLDAFAKVGAMSFGDADIDETGNTLWLVNLYEKTLLTVDVSGATATLNNAAPATLAPLVNEYAISSLPNAPACTGGELRPWGLKFYRGQGYLGVVCDAATSANVADLDAYVLAFDPSNPSAGFTTAVTFGLNYNRELAGAFGSDAQFGAWQPWTNDWATIKATAAAYPDDGTTDNRSHHMPLVSDIDFTDDGSMVIALLDRNGYMLGRANLPPESGSNSLVSHTSAGDIIQACNIGGTFVLEGTGACTVNDDGAGTRIQGTYSQPTDVTDDGPANNGEFYYNDTYAPRQGHNEVGLGALAVLPGRDEVVSTVMDPLGYNDPAVDVLLYGLDVNGVHYYNSTAGNIQDGYLLTKRDIAGGNQLFGKANGMGDLELLLDPAPIEIGNRVWLDENHNGIQDPGEDFMPSVTVLLTDGNGNSYTAVTNAQGEYYFNGSNVSGGLRPNTAYTLTIDTTQTRLIGYDLAPSNVVTTSTTIPDGVDSDAILDGTLATILLTTGNAGENDHSYDFGFHDAALSLGNRLFYDTNNDGLDNDGSGGGLGGGISGVTVQLLDHNNVVTATTTTDGDGYYRFDDLTNGATYTVLIPASNFASGGKLAGYQNSTPTANDATDANDNGSVTGTLGSGGDVRSAAITLVEGTLPMGETAIGGGTHAPDGDRHDDLTIDFGFYHLMLGNRVWYDDNRDGLDGGESGAVGIPVTLTTGSGVVVATTTTDGSGYYTFTNLISGTYIVQIQAPDYYLSSATDDATTNTDLNDNGQGNSGGLISSQVVALTPGSNGGAITVESTHGHTHNLTMDFGLYRPTADLQLLKRVNPPTYTVGVATPVTFTVVITNYGPLAVVNAPVTDTQPVSVTFDSWSCTINGTGSCGAANGSGDINSTVTLDAGSAAIWIVNATIDNTADDPIVNTAREALPPGVLQDIANRPDQANANVVPAQALFSVGNRVWLDTNDDGASSGPGTAVGIPDGLMELVDLTTGQVIQTTYTDANGYYRFDGVPAGTYEIVAAASNFTTDRAIGYRNSSGVITTTTNITSGLPIIDFDDHDHGINSAAPTTINGVHSVPFRLGPGLQPIGEAAVGGGDDGPYGDANSNLTIDFGFNRQHTGNQLWYDTDNDGVYEPGDGEQPLPAGVVVVMHALVGGIDTGPVLTTTTDLNGQYNFDAVNNFDLDPINNPLLIYIAIPAGQAALNSYIPSTGVRHEGGGVDNENTGAINATGVVTSGLFYPLPGDTANGALVFDDLGETYQPTIDFGFVRETFTLGNRVWYDTDNDGFFDPTEQPVAGVIVELLDSSNNYLTETTTNASGYYSFTGLVAGSYLVEVTGRNFVPGAPLYGYQNSTPTTTTTTLADDNHDHGLNVVNGRPGVDGVSSDLITLGSGLQPTGESDGAHGPEGDANDNLTVDFGFYKLVLGNQTWDDEDNNGIYDPAINTTLVVNIRLFAADGVTEILVGPDGVLGTADDATGGLTTGTNGRYEFSGLTPGDYIVKVKTPNGHVSSTGSGSPLIAGIYEPAADPDDNLDEDDNGSDGSGADAGWLVSLPVTLTPGAAGAEGNNVVDNAKGSTTDPTVDFGYVHLVSLGNIIWDDLNNNGLYDSATESGIDGVLVNLYYDANGDGDVADAGETTPLTTTTTAGGGLYLFDNLLAGNYLVELDASNFTTGSVLENYTSSTGRNGSVTGPYETAPDPDASGVDNDDNGTIQGTLGSGGVIRSAVVTLDEGGEPTGENPDNDTVTPDPNENLTVDFGVFRYAELGNYTWIDENKDGIQESSEDPIAGVTLQLYNATDQLVATTTTGPTGHYTFTNLLPGDYSVKFTPPTGYAITQQDQGGDDEMDSDADPVTGKTITTTLILNERDYTWDAGFLPTRFGDRVWIESDDDGLANTPGTTNTPVVGMVITATASSGEVYTTTTNVNGYYSFTVAADTYTVTYGAVPAGYGVVVPSATPGGSSESGNAGSYAEGGNPDQSHTQNTLVTLAAGETNWHVDFAFSAPRVSLGNRLFYDTDDDGMDNDGIGNTLGSSVGIDGATVQLYRDTNGNGSFDLGDAFVTTTQTINGGYYTFTNLLPTTGITSTYLVVITSSNFITGGPLAGYWSSTDITTTLTPDGDVDFDDNGEIMGLLGQPGGLVASRAITLIYNGEPTGENNGGNDSTADDSSNQTVDFGFLRYDWGDLPDGLTGLPDYPTLAVNDGARHFISPLANPILGATVDSEYDGQPTNGAGGDDLATSDDEDGVQIPLLDPSTTVNITVTYSNPTSGTVYLNAWIDFNGDGVMGAGEQIATDTAVAPGAGQLVIPVAVPATAQPGDVYARFRISSDAGLTMTGAASNGEVEDYLALVPPVDLGDLPDQYGTLKSSDGARHPLVSGTRLDGSVDSDPDGMPGVGANGDDTDSDGIDDGDDEDGVQWPAVMAPNSTVPVTVAVVTTGTAYLNAWIDWNGDGDFADELERIVVTDTAVTTGTLVLNVSVPAFITDTLYARFRIADNPDEASQPTGSAQSGEVEDYVLMSLGNTVWLDNGQGGGVADNGILDGSEQGIEGVTVELYHSGDTPGVDTPLATTTTDAAGKYHFTGLQPGDYVVHLPASNFAATTDPLYAHLSSTGNGLPNADADEDVDENGIDDTDPATNGISSGVVTLTLNGEPTTDGDGANGNQTIDFGFLAYDLGDLPDGPYSTLLANDGARHVVSPDLYFGSVVDAEPDGQPSVNADGDDTNIDDEDGIVFMDALMPNTSATIAMTAYVTPGLTAYYGAFIDFNGDGAFDDSEIFTGTIVNGVNTLDITVPSVVSDTIYSRFRIATDLAEVSQPDDVALSGEVEDYVLMSLGNQLWYDTDNSGTYDGGELPIPAGVTLTLVNGTGAVITTTTTDSNGQYRFTGLLPGDYQVIVDAENFQDGGLLEHYLGSTGQDTGDTVDNNDNGDDPAAALVEVNGVRSTVITLALGTEPTTDTNGANSNLTVDFGFYQLVLGNRIWIDENNNGIDDSEPALAVTVIVTATNLTTGDVYTTPTDANGYYIFTGIVSGTYVVSFDAPAGYVSSSTDGNPNGADLDDNGVGSAGGRISSAPFALTPGVNISGVQTVTNATGSTVNPSVDFGVWQPLSLGNRVWLDEGAALSHNNGVDDNETGIQDVVLQLLNGDGTAYDRDPLTAGTQIYTVMTNDTGYYSFTNLISGTYQVQVVASNFTAGNPLAAHVSSDDPATGTNPDNNIDLDDNGPGTSRGVVTSGVITLTYGAEPDGAPDVDGDSDANTNWTVDFGFWRPVLIGDRLWIENDNNGDATDGFVKAVDAGHVVTATSTTSGLVYTGTTNGSGYYTITVPANDTYIVTTDLPDDVLDTPVRATNGSNPVGNNDLNHDRTGTTVVLTTTDNLSIDFGFVTPVNLGNYVWVDSNGNGQQDEPPSDGLDGVTVTLTTPTGAVITTTTVNGGYYTFTNLLPNTQYTVTFTPPAGYGFTTPDQGSDSADSDAPTNGVVVVTTGTTDDYTIDAGLVQALNLGNYVWFDTDKQGDQDAGEPGIAGAVVALYEADGTTPATDLNGNAVASQTTLSDGFYNFTNLAPGGYVVQVTMPAGYTPTVNQVSDPNTDDDTDSNIATSNGNIHSSGVVMLTIGGEPASGVDTDGTNGNLTVDFGFIGVNLGNYVWVDVNGNGIQDEPPSAELDGVTVTLTDVDRHTTISTTSNGGYYTFTNLLPNTQYTVTFTPPAGYGFTTPDQGSDSADSDAPTTGEVVVTTGTTDDYTIDAGLVQALNLGNLVWHDANNNGMVDSGEAGIPNVAVQLFREGDDPTTATPLATATTDASGNYNFDNLAPGRYFVYMPTPPLAYPWSSTPTDTADNGEDNDDNGSQSVLGAPVMSPVIELTVNSEPTNDGDGANGDLTVDFGFFAPASLGDLVWFDTDKDGVQDQGETGVPGTTAEQGVPGVVVTLYDGATNSVVATTTTDTHGRYLFDDLLPGSYYVQFTMPTGYTLSPADQGGNDAFDSDANLTTLQTPVTVLTSGEHDPTLDMGLYLPTEPASIGDLVWYDTDRDGVQDSGETGVPGIAVTLYRADGSPVATTTTDVNGAYEFNSLPPGDYYVAFTPPAAYTISPQDTVADNDGIDSDVDPTTGHTVITTLLAGENDPTWDLGLYLADQPASIGDTVWFDGDVDGLQEAGETGVPGVLVALYRADGLLVATTHTDVDGHYQFTNLVPGDYFVEFSPPSGYYGTHPDQGTADDVDSDADPITGRTAVTTLTAGENDPTWDYGIFLFDERTSSLLAPAEIGNRVWLDADHDGVQDPGEVNVPGVTVKLYTSDGQLVAIDITDANGVYGFANLVPGTYYVEFVLPDGNSYSPVNTLPGDDTDSNADPETGRTPLVTLPSNTTDPTWDAGIYPTPTSLDDDDEPVKVRILLPLIAR